MKCIEIFLLILVEK